MERGKICQVLDDFLKVSQVGFPDGLNEGFQRKRGIKHDSKIFILSN